MKTSKEMQLKILDKMRENVESGNDLLKGIQYRNRVDLLWDDRVYYIGTAQFERLEMRIKPKTITINGVEITRPLTEDEMKNLDNDGVYFPCSNPAMYSVESKKYCILNNAWKNVGYKSMEEAIEASKALFGIEG